MSEFTNNFERSILMDEQICSLIKNDETFAQEFYAAMCNIIWSNLPDNQYSMSWRYAGGFVSCIVNRLEDFTESVNNIHELGDYMDFYCSGGEGKVTPRVEAEMKRLGWIWAEHL